MNAEAEHNQIVVYKYNTVSEFCESERLTLEAPMRCPSCQPRCSHVELQ